MEILERLVDPTAARRALEPILEQTPFGTNRFFGHRTKRAFGLPAKTRALDDLLTHPEVLRRARTILQTEHVLLSTAAAVEIHPGETAQTTHDDNGAWPGEGERVVNAIWAIDDFTADNGATRFEDGTAAVMPSGSVLVYPGSERHGGGANTTDAPRLGLIVGYIPGWLRQQENYALLMPPEKAKEAPHELQRLLGYDLYPPFIGHVDGRNPDELLG